ncbi:ribosome-recycling factor [Candidatus Saccharibacteria bacterium]|jgi:ribosome recycling factor|nr:ribosome-recycling factor [Candidatus Saccharibacteria bacterium]
MDYLKQAQQKFNDSIDHLNSELTGVRTGRASAGLVDTIKVEVYGQSMPLKSVATITTPDAKTIQIQPWDQSNLSFIEKAISENQNLGLTPNNDGRVIRVNIPPLNEETRTQLTKVCKEKAESANISMRNARHEVLNSAKADEKANVITQDQLVKVQKDLDKLIDEYHQKIQKIVEDKEKEIMSV